MDDRVGSRGSSSETESVAVVAMFVFGVGILLAWLVGFGKSRSRLVADFVCWWGACFFFASDRRPAKDGKFTVHTCT